MLVQKIGLACNGWFHTEYALRDHMQTAHRRFVFGQNTFQNGGIEPDSPKNQLITSKEAWAKLSLRLRNRVQARFSEEELDTIDRFILLGSQSSVL